MPEVARQRQRILERDVIAVAAVVGNQTADNGHYVKSDRLACGWAAAAHGPTRRRPLARDLRLFRQLLPDRLPCRDQEADLLAEARDLGGEGLADLVVVTGLEAVLAIAHVLGRAGTAEDVHRAYVPLGEGGLRLRARGRG